MIRSVENRLLRPEFLRSGRGSTITLVAVIAAVLMGVAAYGVDLGHMYVTKSRLQSAADAAALASIGALPDIDAVRARAREIVATNMPVSEHGNVVVDADVQVGRWDASTRNFFPGEAPNDAVRVFTRRSQANGNTLQLFFATFLGSNDADVSAVAIATRGQAICVLALDQTMSGAVSLNSNAELKLTNCSLWVNSNSSSALRTDSNSEVDVQSISIDGGYSQQGSSQISPTPATGAGDTPDPLAGLPAPASSGCTHTSRVVRDNVTATLDPGIYCGGIEIKNNAQITLNPGTYVIKNDSFFVDSNSRLTGNGVSIFLTGNGGVIDFDSNARISLSAPSTGDLAGIVMYQDRNFGGTHNLDSNVNTMIKGVVYFPNGQVRVDSNTAIAMNGCTFFVAKSFSFDSNGGFDLNYDPSQCDVPIPSRLRGFNRLVH